MAARIETPCTKICTLDPGRTQCMGCGRTVDEITRWSSMTAAERAAVMAELPARLARRRAALPAAVTE
jgi:predicted Fe-S protein YdhL (DUF1289 family)